MNKIYFIRHGDYQHSDDSLTEYGKLQSKKVGSELAERDRKYVIFTSPYTRAVETAKIIGNYIDHIDFIKMDLDEIEK